MLVCKAFIFSKLDEILDVLVLIKPELAEMLDVFVFILLKLDAISDELSFIFPKLDEMFDVFVLIIFLN